ncbi:hypothetical protein IWX58_004147 [Rubrivivax gelatinosus]|nr:hypothetical protein [Rubrivivax gelatinosus]
MRELVDDRLLEADLGLHGEQPFAQLRGVELVQVVGDHGW